MKFNNNEEAVSPVIGVILMVAITVILAAVIAVFVFGMADDIDSGHIAAATAKVSGEDVIVTYQGGNDPVKLLTGTIYDATGDNKTFTAGATGVADEETEGYFAENDPVVGFSYTFASVRTGAADDAVRIVVVATFEDDASQVLLDKNF